LGQERKYMETELGYMACDGKGKIYTMEHKRQNGLMIGYYCPNCGKGGLNMYGMGDKEHKGFSNNPARTCTPNPKLVAILDALNE